MNKILKRVVYSINLLFSGRDDLALGRRFVVSELKGDWEYFKFIFQFSSSWTALRDICFRCDAKGRSANESELYFCTEGQSWHEYDVTEFISRQLGHGSQTCS